MKNSLADFTMKQKSQLRTRMRGLYRNPNNPFEAFDEDGRPCLPLTIDDDAPSNGITPGPFGNTNPNTGRSLISSLAEELNWKT